MMITSRLGKSDLEVSKICLGTMVFGEQVDYKSSTQIMDYSVGNGVNFFDVAEIYPVPPRRETYGRSEEFVGKYMSERGCRNKLIIATKVTGRSSGGPGVGFDWIRQDPRLSREHIISAAEASLRRLKTDYIDLYQLHWPERQVNIFGRHDYVHDTDDGYPLAESLAALEELVSQGKVRYYGISNETPWGMMKCVSISEKEGYKGIQSIQNPYSLLSRLHEVAGSEVSIREQIPLLAYSPLCFGVLTGKYMSGEENKSWRLHHPAFNVRPGSYARYNNPMINKILTEYKQIAERASVSLTTLALAFVNQRDFIGANIIGATTLEQIQENVDSINCKLSSETIDEINKIHAKYRNPCP